MVDHGSHFEMINLLQSTNKKDMDGSKTLKILCMALKY